MQQQQNAGQEKGSTATQRGSSNRDEPQQAFDQPEEHLEETQEQPKSPEQQTAEQPQSFGREKDISILKDSKRESFCLVAGSCGCFAE
ncbi:hypothetical protein PBY51_015970 [Eleginops maclovinus]|uniref:Uncharacterized protein n=1 Tax=Eleginops maclovinus TaxID=56733 RepID=A0AAN7XMD3_ELEMC|nr:hypothetical protein PBY51_015970 [Eleginops maclovinus]